MMDNYRKSTSTQSRWTEAENLFLTTNCNKIYIEDLAVMMKKMVGELEAQALVLGCDYISKKGVK